MYYVCRCEERLPSQPLPGGSLFLYSKTTIGHRKEMREVDTAVIDNVFYHRKRREWLREACRRNGGQGWLHRMHWKTPYWNTGCRFVLPGERAHRMRKKKKKKKRDRERTARTERLSLIVYCVVHNILYFRTLYRLQKADWQ